MVDLVIIGFGGAGAAAAIEARRLGAHVLVVERATRGLEGGNTRVAAQGFLNLKNQDAGKRYVEALAAGTEARPERLAAWAADASRNVEWLESFGATCEQLRNGRAHAEYPELPGAEAIAKFGVSRDADGRGGLWPALHALAHRMDVTIEFGCAAERLICTGAGDVAGVRCVDASGSKLTITASRGVVLATGGFAASTRHLRQHAPAVATAATAGSPYSTGDGVDLAATVGARLSGMTAVAGPYLAFLPPGSTATVPPEPLLPQSPAPVGGFVVVNADGFRFINERGESRHGRVFDSGSWRCAEIPTRSFLVFDQALMRNGPLVSAEPRYGWAKAIAGFQWSEDSRRELSLGWIIAADSMVQLADHLGCDDAVLGETIRDWNAGCSKGIDRRFGRKRALSPLEGPPYYALPLVPSILNTQGGPERDALCQVIGHDGRPINGLYSAGELGSVFTGLYQGAGNLADCLVSGRTAARNAMTSGGRAHAPGSSAAPLDASLCHASWMGVG